MHEILENLVEFDINWRDVNEVQSMRVSWGEVGVPSPVHG